MSNYIPVFLRGCNYLSICLFRPAIFLVGQIENLVHSASLRRGNNDVAPDSTERPGLHQDEEKLSNVLEEDMRIEKMLSATEPHFKSDSFSPSLALSEDQDNATKRFYSLRKRRSVEHRDINKLNNLVSKQQESLDALLNTYVSSGPWEISFPILTTLITHSEWYHIVRNCRPYVYSEWSLHRKLLLLLCQLNFQLRRRNNISLNNAV